MGLFGKKKDDDQQDPKKALQKADNMLNKGFMGGLTKAFMGQDFVDKMNTGIAQGNQAINSMDKSKEIAQTGADATAEVMSVQDTGSTVNENPMLILTLKITPAAGGAEIQTAAQVLVPRIAIPRAGDKIKIKYNPANPSEIAIL
jgi:hypothetical protein